MSCHHFGASAARVKRNALSGTCDHSLARCRIRSCSPACPHTLVPLLPSSTSPPCSTYRQFPSPHPFARHSHPLRYLAQSPNPPKCLPSPLLPRPPPLPARLLLARLLRRRRLARRPLLPLATRRSAPRPERRPTPPTSTRVCAPPSTAHFRFQVLTCFFSSQAGPSRHRYLQSRHVHSELFRQRYVSRTRSSQFEPHH